MGSFGHALRRRWVNSGLFLRSSYGSFLSERGVVAFIRVRWVYSVAPLGSPGFVGYIRARLSGRWDHSVAPRKSLPSLEHTQEVVAFSFVGFIRQRSSSGSVGFIRDRPVGRWVNSVAKLWSPVHSVSPLGSSGSFGFVGFIGACFGDRCLLSGATAWSLGSFGRAQGVIVFICSRSANHCFHSGSFGSLWHFLEVFVFICSFRSAVKFIRARTGGHRIHSVSLGSFERALGS